MPMSGAFTQKSREMSRTGFEGKGFSVLSSLAAMPPMYRIDIAAPGLSDGRPQTWQRPGEDETSFFMADGISWEYLPLEGGGAMICGAHPVPSSLVIPPVAGGLPVTHIAPRAFTECRHLEEVVLPDTVEVLGDFAFLETGLTSFVAPGALREVGTRCFGHCLRLKSISLGDALETIGPGAFEYTALSEVFIPAGVHEIGARAFWHTNVRFGAADRTFSISADNPHLLLDRFGCLYSRSPEGLVLEHLLDASEPRIEVASGTMRIAARSCEANDKLLSLKLPEGLLEVGESAFVNCFNLHELELPATLERVGAYAFKETAIEELHIPAALTAFGRGAFATTHRGAMSLPTLRHIEVDPANPVFYMDDGLLCARCDDGRDWAVLYGGNGATSAIPPQVSGVAPDCYKGVESVRTLVLHQGIEHVGTGCFYFGPGLECIRVLDGLGPGRNAEIRFPTNRAGFSYSRMCFKDGIPPVREIYGFGDAALLASGHTLQTFSMMCARMEDPVCLSADNERGFCRLMTHELDKVVILFARGNNLDGFDMLTEKGIVNEENYDDVIELLSAAGETPAVSRLLEMRRSLTCAPPFDFEL